jgi:hypothetical protein
MDSYKLQVKVGEHEFSSEGPVESVKEAFEAWKELISLPSPGQLRTNKERINGFELSAGYTLDTDQLNRIFHYDSAKDLISVKIFPRGDDRNRDTLLMILYGYKTLKTQHEVLATKLTPAMKQSGCKIDRLDRIASRYINQGLINKGGMGKSGHYSLTNTGMVRAVEIINELLTR